MNHDLRRLPGCAVSCATITTCAPVRAPVIPMEILRDATSCTTPAPVLLVMLPGAYGVPADFREHGFVSAVRNRGLAADIVMTDTHLGHFTDHSLIRRLRENIVLPGRSTGHRQIWLVGISLGGLAALGYAARHGSEIEGVVAIAPYPGSREVLREIAAAGGPASWHARGCVIEEDLEREAWSWLAAGMTERERMPPAYLAYGSEDRFAEGHRLIADTLPGDRSRAVPGGHDWAPWHAAWEDWLDRGLLPRSGTEHGGTQE